jgi:hypothetical protein
VTFAGGSQVHTFPIGTFTPSGTVNFNAGTITINNPFSATRSISGAAVTINATETVSSVNLSGGSLTGTGTLTISDTMTWSGGTVGGAGALVVDSSAALNVTGTGVRTSDRAVTINGTANLSHSNLTLVARQSLTVASNAILNVRDNVVVIDYTQETDALDDIRALLDSGFNGGAWNGLGINSSAAAGTPNRALGLALWTDIGSPSSFLGVPIS